MQDRQIVVLGAKGMLGQMVACYLSSLGRDVIGTQFSDPSAPWYFDATAGTESWFSVLGAVRSGGYLINCIGILKNLIREEEPASVATAVRVNALFPHLLADSAAKRGLRVIAISTDGVFAPGRQTPCVETDASDCGDAYGLSKAMGESAASNVLNIRCSIIGRDRWERKGILEWLLIQPDESQVTGFRDQLWNGVTTLQFAQLCDALITQDAFESVRRVSHLHHFCPNPVTDKYRLLCDWRDAAGKAVTIVPADSHSGQSRVLGTVYDCIPRLYLRSEAWLDVLTELFSSRF